MSEHIVILGAGSGIARAVAERLAANGAALLLAGRNVEELERCAADLNVRHQVAAAVRHFDATDYVQHAGFVAQCVEHFDGHVDGVLLCFGTLPDQQECERDEQALRHAIDVNFTGAASILHAFASQLESQKSGWIAAISSVAGDRGRQSNYVYGAAKAGLTAMLQGLRNRLHASGVHVLTIKPGFVATAMTHGIVNPDSPLTASPERVAVDIEKAIRKRRHTVYTPWFWGGIMAIITRLPETIFKRLKL